MAVPLRDMESENLLDSLEVRLDFIDESRKTGSVLVHCFAGVSRSSNFAADPALTKKEASILTKTTS
ncbi:putative phosphoric monoester hydrolase [Helianthus annuus]|nr:putative phosphoric monoester hydrolase [Helianthus annuus]